MRVSLLLVAAAAATLVVHLVAETTGPEVGTAIPSFEAEDQNGRLQTLQSLAGPKGTLLLFHRSADWCPFCKVQLVELERDLPRIKAQGLGVAAISYDSVEILKHFADRRNISFPLLSDPDSKIIRAFGILNETAPRNSPFWGIPRPGTYLVDPKGIVISKTFADDAGERDTAAEVLAAQSPGKPAETRYFRLNTSPPNQFVHQGQHVPLVLDLDLKPKMHVYAPEVQGYIAIDWKIADSPSYTVTPVVYPKPEILRLDVIKETVPVYHGKLHLTRELIVGPVKSPSDVTVEGTLRYQVCDDRECYLPATQSLKWNLHFEPLDRERVPANLQRK